MATKVVREKVVAFRVTPEQYEEFEKKIKDAQIAGIGSPGLMARKMCLDFLLDQLKWPNKKLRTTSTEIWLAETKAKPAAESVAA